MQSETLYGEALSAVDRPESMGYVRPAFVSSSGRMVVSGGGLKMNALFNRARKAVALALTTAILSGGLLAVAAPISAAASSGKSFTVMVMGVLTGPQSFTTPEIVPAVEGALRHTSGIKVVSCD